MASDPLPFALLGSVGGRHFFKFLWPLTIAAAVFFAAPNGWAVIRVDSPLTKSYELARAVLIGRVARIDANEKSIDVEVLRVLKGEFAARGIIQIQLADVNDYFLHVEINQPVVILNGLKESLVHLADNFLTGDALSQTDRPRIVVKTLNPIQTRFPGRTSGLVRLVDEIASGHPTLLNMTEHVVWNGGIIDRGKVLPNAEYIITPHLNGHAPADVLIGNSRSTQLLSNTGESLRDETLKWGLRKASGKWAASADVNGDGRIDLLIGTQFWLNRGNHFSPGPVLTPPTTNDILAGALLGVSGHELPDAIFLTNDGNLYTFENPGRDDANWKMLPTKRLWNDAEKPDAAVFSSDWGDTGKTHVMVARASGLTRYALDPDGGPPAEFDRLTGGSLKVNSEMYGRARWDTLALVSLDINGDSQQDLIAIFDKGGATFVNRGFGTFFLNPLATDAIFRYDRDQVPWKVTRGTRFGAGDLHGDKFDDLLILTPDGKLFELNNTPYERMPNRFQ